MAGFGLIAGAVTTGAQACPAPHWDRSLEGSTTFYVVGDEAGGVYASGDPTANPGSSTSGYVGAAGDSPAGSGYIEAGGDATNPSGGYVIAGTKDGSSSIGIASGAPCM
jgi:hypothetical protein